MLILCSGVHLTWNIFGVPSSFVPIVVLETMIYDRSLFEYRVALVSSHILLKVCTWLKRSLETWKLSPRQATKMMVHFTIDFNQRNKNKNQPDFL